MAFQPHHFLCITNFLMLVPIYEVYIKNKRSIFEIFLSCLLVVAFIFSQLFWLNPIRFSIEHKIDVTWARVVTFFFITYTILLKKHSFNKFLQYVFICFCLCFTFYWSNYFSSRDWCSLLHLLFHVYFHTFAFLGSLFAF
jgi:Ca2+/Na+ antiporter